ncbi:hypothetical protein F5148DRAFT_1287740 [Russula earlei]|uniref:Uncharacterized protein n=1 Tax=Russula earlei TaxID=71964 RepID=A0ACC0U148_9AGAM|nr:hypothetical protein F5148DRAFT_1287740 [Russula earlei]
MTGANYTGGKRNVARSRFRNSTRRVQKDHFGRRRLGILRHSLVNGAHPQEEKAAAGIQGINLEHAQREISRPPISLPFAYQTGGPGALSFLDPSSPPRSSRTGPDVTPPELEATNRFPTDQEAFPPKGSSLRAEVDRVLEFSRTVGLCNYSTSPRPGILVSPLSHLGSESARLDPPRQQKRNLVSPMSVLFGRLPTDSCISHADQDTGAPTFNLMLKDGD